MRYIKTQSSELPSKVTLEKLPEGSTTVILTGEAARIEEEGSVTYEYDEVRFTLPEERTGETVQSIEKNFGAWWEYGQQDEPEVTLEQRVSDLEEMLLSILEG